MSDRAARAKFVTSTLAVGCAAAMGWLLPSVALGDPATIDGVYPSGKLERLEVAGRKAYLISPTVPIDAQRRWVWVAPWSRAVGDENGDIEHRFYVDRLLSAGFHVAGVDVGTSCGSPRGAEVYQKLYERLTGEFKLNRKARLLGQSNGGLISYAWAFRHPESVERIGGIYPATDFRSWPGLDNVLKYPEPSLAYGLSLDELTQRAAEFNPIDNLAPLAKAGVKIFHIHGDQDKLVPADVNSQAVVERYQRLGGEARLEIIPGLGHGGKVFFRSESLLKFLLE
jgi:pimeloyl-ACP methyl ester carboxylesterase